MSSFITRRQFLSVTTKGVIVSIAGLNRSAEVNAGSLKKQVPTVIQEQKKKTIQDRVKKIIADLMGVDVEKVVPNASIEGDLGADSLDSVEIIMELEEEFDILIPEEDADNLTTVQDFIDYIKKRKAKTHPQGQDLMQERLYLRDAKLSDVHQIAEITFRSWQKTHAQILELEFLRLGTIKFFRERWVKLLKELNDETSCLVLIHADRIIAVGASGSYRLDSNPPDKTVNQLLSRSRYGEFFRGYGESNLTMRNKAEMLFVALSHRLLEHGFDKAGLWTNSANMRMRRFAESMGGTYITNRPAVIFGRTVPSQQEVFYSFDL